MSPTPQLFRIKPDEKQSNLVDEVDFSTLGLQEPRDIQKWVADNPRILSEGLLIITEQFSGFDRTREQLDLLAVDTSGNLVIIELKRDDSGAEVHWQAIKYASYLDRATPSEIVRMLASYKKSSEEDATTNLQDHLGAEDLSTLNNSQRIILASHRFAPEVTSAVLWLNEQAGKGLITCVQLTPYQDMETKALYLLANTIIPVPGVEAYRIQVKSGGSYGLASQPGQSTRRPRFKFSMVDISPGEELQMVGDPNQTCKVIDDDQVEYQGQTYRLSTLTAQLKNTGSIQGALHWVFEGETLQARRNRYENITVGYAAESAPVVMESEALSP